MAHGRTVQRAVAMALVLMWGVTVQGQEFSGGTGEPNDPYLIGTAQDLIDLGQRPEIYDKHFRLTTDIDLLDHTFDQAVIAPETGPYTLWEFSGTPFTGVLDGSNHVIRHLHIEGENFLGLFGCLADSAVVRDLGSEECSIRGTGDYLAGLAGLSDGSISNCYSTGTVSGGEKSYYVGGLVASNEHGSMSNCYSGGTVSGGGWGYNVGGLAGWNGDGPVLNCHSTAAVTGICLVGGLVGDNLGGVFHCYSTGAVTGSEWSNSVGGLMGRNFGGHVSNCYSTGAVTAVDFVGGLVGAHDVGSILNCWTTGAVTGRSNVGGLLGESFCATQVNCYSAGAVRGESGLGGLIGDDYKSNVLSCFWDVEASGLATGSPGVGLTTGEMQDVHTYLAAGWDLLGESANGTAETWQMPPVGGYPKLSLLQGWQPVLPKGQGTPTAPFLITNAQELGSIGYRPRASYRLETDVDLSDSTWAIAPVPWFAGHFDGSGHVIRHLSIQGADFLGLFGFLSDNATVTGVGLEDGSIQGSGDYVGGLAGENHGHVSNCYSTVTVTGNGMVGGLVGDSDGSVSRCWSKGTITGDGAVGGLLGRTGSRNVSNCYSTGAVTGNRYTVGGLVGTNFADVSNCYSTGAVSGGEAPASGLIGNNGGRVVRSFWNTESSGVAHGWAGAALTTTEMMDPEWIGLQGWADDPNWVLNPHMDYPRLAWEGTEGQMIPEPALDWIAGEGTPGMPYEIDDPNQLFIINKASLFWQGSLLLRADLDLADIVWPQAVIAEFAGTFDGNGHVITNLRISGGSNLAFFGNLNEGAKVLDLGLVSVDIMGQGNVVAGLASRNYVGELSNCYVSGKVTGESTIGGLVAANLGYIVNCHSLGDVTGTRNVGGLVGENLVAVSNCYGIVEVTGEDSVGGLIGYNSGDVSNSRSSGMVTGTHDVGGFVGKHSTFQALSNCYSTAGASGHENIGGLIGHVSSWSSVLNCYSSGAVVGNRNVGGLVGFNDRGDVADCFWDIETSGQATSVAAIGLTTAAMQDISTYLDAGWDFVGETDNGVEDIWWIDDGQDYPRLWWELLSEAL